MRKTDQIIAHFGSRIALPAAVVVVGALAIVIISLGEMANEVNRIEDKLTERSVAAATEVVLRRIGQTHRDYAVWDDAARRLYGDVDQAFLEEGFISASQDAVFFDTFYVIDETGTDLFGYHAGERLAETSAEKYGARLDDMIAALPRDGTAYEVHTGFLETGSGVAVVAVGPIVPFSDDFEPRPTAARLLVVSRVFDQAAVARLGSDFLIDDLQMADPAAAGPLSVLVADPTGRTIGALAWTSRELGNEAQSRVSPIVFVMLALVSATMIFLLVLTRRSVHEIRRKEEQARHAATHDALTGLPNRDEAVSVINDAIVGRERGMQVAAIYIDIDRFKDVDDSYGHETGDRLLLEIASLFRECADEHFLAKVGGDEFVLVVVDRQATKIACDIGWRMIESLAEPFDIGGRIIPVAVNIGIAVADKIDPSADELLRRADVAMVQAKHQGSRRFVLYEPVIDTVRHERLSVADDLRRALKVDEGLSLVYQPILDAKSREVVGVEALLRWDRPVFGLVPPDEFVPIAEEAGLIDALTRWTLRRACADASRWPDVRLSVNISPYQFRDPNFDSNVTAILSETGFSAGRLELEVIESGFLVESDQARRTVEAFRARGMTIALDDFGTGYSSIGYLRCHVFDRIKLDRSIIVGIEYDEKTNELVRAAVALAHSLDLQVTAEGVESPKEAKLLSRAGCKELQGHYLAAPVPAAEVSDLLESLERASSLGAIA